MSWCAAMGVCVCLTLYFPRSLRLSWYRIQSRVVYLFIPTEDPFYKNVQYYLIGVFLCCSYNRRRQSSQLEIHAAFPSYHIFWCRLPYIPYDLWLDWRVRAESACRWLPMRRNIVWLQREGNRRDILQKCGGGILRAAKSKIRSSSCSYSVVQLSPARADSLLSSVS